MAATRAMRCWECGCRRGVMPSDADGAAIPRAALPRLSRPDVGTRERRPGGTTMVSLSPALFTLRAAPEKCPGGSADADEARRQAAASLATSRRSTQKACKRTSGIRGRVDMYAEASQSIHRWPASIPTRTIRDCISAGPLLFRSHGRVVNYGGARLSPRCCFGPSADDYELSSSHLCPTLMRTSLIDVQLSPPLTVPDS
jgi:hypothetical protein